LTYPGILRVLFASKKNTADKFLNWATKTLFAAQLGTKSQKEELVGNLMGVSTKVVNKVFNKSSNSIPSIYLYSIGQVKALRKELKLDEKYNGDDFVYIYGMSEDLPRRTKEHERSYGKIFNFQLELVLFGIIDQQYMSDAETKLSHMFKGMNMKIELYNGLVIIPKQKIKIIKEQYEIILSKYQGHMKDIIQLMIEKDNMIELMKERHEKELMKVQYEKEILKKDLGIANMKLSMKK